LYIAGPNVSAKAQQKIADWIHHTPGSVLVVLPGACVADEYNNPVVDENNNNRINLLLGLNAQQPRPDIRNVFNPTTYTPVSTKTLDIVDTSFGFDSAEEQEIVEPTQSLNVDGATVIGKFNAGGSGDDTAISVKAYDGGGKAIAFGFFPGLHYWRVQHLRDNPSGIPLYWDEPIRKIIVAPAILANTPKAVPGISHEMVEVCPLYSDKGIALVLLNWGGQPINSFSVTMHVRVSSHISSAKDVPITTQRLGPSLFGPLKITLSSLEYVDVVMIEPPPQ
ncbi:MAG: hypothetical protein M3247_09195, partial [Thermoproteota archaeon]|nr:hypothetical protein [Thermoproteota archaeon]